MDLVAISPFNGSLIRTMVVAQDSGTVVAKAMPTDSKHRTSARMSASSLLVEVRNGRILVFLCISGSFFDELSFFLDACFLPKIAGPCEGYYPSWYYDPVVRTCRQFIYGGCLGNNNKFQTYEQCEQLCVQPDRLGTVFSYCVIFHEILTLAAV